MKADSNSKTGRKPKLTRADVLKIRRRYQARELGKDLAKEFKRDPATISAIVNGEPPYDY